MSSVMKVKWDEVRRRTFVLMNLGSGDGMGHILALQPEEALQIQALGGFIWRVHYVID